MSYSEEVVTETRLRMTKTRALAAWERTRGVCVTCEMKIDGVKQRWFVEHIRALELGGKDEDDNLGPAHVACKAGKDADDHHRAAKAKEAKRIDLGIKDPNRRRMPGGRDSNIKIKMDGTRVDRRTGERL
jgi:hypothetical protein